MSEGNGLTVYHPRQPQQSPLWKMLDKHYASFEQEFEQKYRKTYGYRSPDHHRTTTEEDPFKNLARMLIRRILEHFGLWQERVPKCLPPPVTGNLVTIVCEEFDDGWGRSNDQDVTLH